MPNEKAWMRSDLKIEGMTANEICETEKWMKYDRKWQFLQRNESLVEVVREDAATLERLGIAPEQVANRLASLINQFHYNFVKTRIHTGEEIQQVEKRGTLIEDRYFVQVIEELGYMEKQPCYFEVFRNLYSIEELIEMNRKAGSDEKLSERLATKQYLERGKHTTASATYRIVDMKDRKWHISGRSLEFAAVMIHSIRAHHFFGGPKARMRIDPKRTAEFLGLESGKEYSSGRQELDTWFRADHTPSFTDDFRHSGLTKKYGDRVPLQEGLIAYIWVQNGVIVSDRHLKLDEPLMINDVLVDLQGNEIHPGQTIIRHDLLIFDIG